MAARATGAQAASAWSNHGCRTAAALRQTKRSHVKCQDQGQKQVKNTLLKSLNDDERSSRLKLHLTFGRHMIFLCSIAGRFGEKRETPMNNKRRVRGVPVMGVERRHHNGLYVQQTTTTCPYRSWTDRTNHCGGASL